MIYLDNSATTHHKPRSIIKASTLGLTKYSINPNRSGYSRAIEAQTKVFECREKLAEFLA